MLQKNIRLILTCCWIIIIAICSFLVYLIINERRQNNGWGCAVIYDDSTFYYNEKDTNYIDGKAVFLSNCASCHNPLKDMTGPAMKTIALHRSPEWIYSFLIDHEFQSDDFISTQFKERYDARCIKFPQLTYDEIDAIVSYIDGCSRAPTEPPQSLY